MRAFRQFGESSEGQRRLESSLRQAMKGFDFHTKGFEGQELSGEVYLDLRKVWFLPSGCN